MGHNIRIGWLLLLVGGLIGSAAMVISQLYVFIGFLIAVIIWACLFALPFSPVKRCWWSAADKLVIMTLQHAGYNPRASSKYISVWVELRPRSSIMVDRIVLKIGREKVTSFDWESHDVSSVEHKFVDFERPDWLHVGEHEAKLIACTPEGYSKSNKFVVEVDV